MKKIVYLALLLSTCTKFTLTNNYLNKDSFGLMAAQIWNRHFQKNKSEYWADSMINSFFYAVGQKDLDSWKKITNNPSSNLDLLASLSSTNYQKLLEKGMKQKDLDVMALEYCRTKETCFVGIIWPPALKHQELILKEIEKYSPIIYKKTVKIYGVGKENIIKTIPEKKDHVSFHLKIYFPPHSGPSYTAIVILCEFENADLAAKCKQEIRAKVNMFPTALHFNDTHEQAVTLAESLFNDNSLYFINNKNKRYSAKKFLMLFKVYKEWIKKNNLDPEDFCVDGSGVLAAYGIRDINVDFDFLYAKDKVDVKLPLRPNLKVFFEGSERQLGPMDLHNTTWRSVGCDPLAAIFNPDNYFYHEGVKITTLDHIAKFKKAQGRNRDKDDINLITRFKNKKRI